jgi:hypothetical protein
MKLFAIIDVVPSLYHVIDAKIALTVDYISCHKPFFWCIQRSNTFHGGSLLQVKFLQLYHINFLQLFNCSMPIISFSESEKITFVCSIVCWLLICSLALQEPITLLHIIYFKWRFHFAKSSTPKLLLGMDSSYHVQN